MRTVKFILLMFFLFLITGCAAVYPVQKNNVYAEAVQFSLPAQATTPAVSPEKVAREIVDGLSEFKLGPQEKKKVAEFVVISYNDNFNSSNVSNEARITTALHEALSKTQAYFLSKSSHADYKGKTTLENFDIKWNGNHGRATAFAKAAPVIPHGSLFKKGDVTITFDVDFVVDNSKIQVTISNVSYFINCKDMLSGGNLSDCSIEDIFIVNDAALKGVLAETSHKGMKTLDWFALQAKQLLEKRYSTTFGGEAKEVTLTFDVDFVTAKARLQRMASGDFKYDNEKSTFTFTKQFPYQSGVSSAAKHTIVASLFPDRNKTIFVVSGFYEQYKDALGIEDLASQKDFDANMKTMVARAKEILSE